MDTDGHQSKRVKPRIARISRIGSARCSRAGFGGLAETICNSPRRTRSSRRYCELGKQEPRKSGERGLKLVRLPPSLAATLATLPSISEIPFLDFCVRTGKKSPDHLMSAQ